MLDSKLQSLKDHFGITHPEDWQAVKPEWILLQDGCGPVTLDYLRLLLAARGLTLKNDRTPEHWQAHLKDVRISHTLGNEEISLDVDRGVICPFTIIVDTAEQFPFTFQGIKQDDRPLIINTESRALGRFPQSLGDYAPDNGIGRCHVERKSMQDAHATILGWAKKGEDVGRRERFEHELERLSEMEQGLVVVECSFPDLLNNAPEWGVRTKQQNARSLNRSILAWIQDYSVPWLFMDNRRLAERETFLWINRWWRKDLERRKEEEKRLAGLANGNERNEKANGSTKRAAEVQAQLAAL